MIEIVKQSTHSQTVARIVTNSVEIEQSTTDGKNNKKYKSLLKDEQLK